MTIERGRVVCSTAGKDKCLFMVVLSSDDRYVQVADGHGRPLQRAKRKNIKHITLTSIIFDEAKMATNRGLRAALKAAFPMSADK